MKVLYIFLALISYTLGATTYLKSSRPSYGIVGGQDAEVGEFPYQVSIQLGMPFEHVSNGAIISETWVLTSASSILDQDLENLRIVAGILQLDDGEEVLTRQILNIVRQLVHEDYSGSLSPNDIGLIEVETPFIWNDAVQPVSLPSPNYDTTGDAVYTGWGIITDDFFPYNRLQKAVVPVLDNPTCNDSINALVDPSLNTFDYISNVCTGPLTGGVSACIYDGGDPLVQDGTIIGLASWGIMPCGALGAPTVHTRVSSFIDWIDDKMNS